MSTGSVEVAMVQSFSVIDCNQWAGKEKREQRS